MARRRKPHDPAAAIRAEAKRLIQRSLDMEAVSLQREAAVLDRMSDVEITRAGQKREGQKVTGNSARRVDAFDALREGLPVGCYDAARRLERDILLSRGQGDRGAHMERVDGSGGMEREFRFIVASSELRALVGRLAPRDWWLLHELIAPSRDYDGWQPVREDAEGRMVKGEPIQGWRAAVAYITGETHTHAQGAAVRAACVNLRDVYEALERRSAA